MSVEKQINTIFESWLIDACNKGKTIKKITLEVNKIIENELLQNSPVNNLPRYIFTKDLFYFMGLEKETTQKLIRRAINLIRIGEEPFLGGKFITQKGIKELIKKIYPNHFQKN